LPGLLALVGPIDLFIHDSKHSADNMRLAWSALRRGGAIVVDDIDASDGFHLFCESVVDRHAWACEAEPIRIDERRANGKGVFGA
jgi:hypothetical protein